MQPDVFQMTMPSETSPSDPDWPALQRQRRAIVVVDVVESVRLMQANEADVIDRWRRFVNEVRTQVLPVHGGRLVKSLGDGLLLEFEGVPAAVAASLDIQRRIAPFNAGRLGDAVMGLRIGVHVADVVVDDVDIYGAGVNLAGRLATLARSDDVVVSAQVRDDLVQGLDADFEDLGECFLKHIPEPVRAYQVGSMHDAGRNIEPGPELPELRPTVAVIPFRAVPGDVMAQLIGDALADDVIAGLSTAREMNVISRLSTATLRDRDVGLTEVARHLGAGYVLSGRVLLAGQRIKVSLELADTANARVLWAESVFGDARDVFHSDQALAAEIASKVGVSVIQSEVRRSGAQPLVTLKSHSLLLGAINLMHRTSLSDFDRARQLLEHLVERERRHPRPHAWLANWHALRVTQSHSAAPQEDTRRALDHARRALDCDPQCSLALAIDGVLQINLVKDLDTAELRLAAALEANPNEALAWLFKGVLHAFKAQGALAEEASTRALDLSPLDPMRHYYDSLAATAALGAGNYPQAIQLAQRSLRGNRLHPSTYRTLAMAQVMAGEQEEAAATVRQLLLLTPGYRVSDFKVLSGWSAGPLKDHFAGALRSAGLPA